MRQLIVRRLVQAIPLLFIVSFLTFFLVSLIPGSVATALIGTSGTPAAYARMERQLGLNKPVFVQYWHWLYRVLHGNLGSSLQNKQSVAEMLNSRLTVTLTLIVATVIVVSIVGVGLGVVSSVRGGFMNRIIDLLSWLGLAVPNFWLGLVLVSTFAVTFHVFPALGLTAFSSSPVGWLKSLVLPVIALAAAPIAVVMRQTRDAMSNVLEGEFIRTLRASGLTERSIVMRHALKNASLPVVSVLGVLLVSLLGGTVIVENVFAIPGLGSLAVSAVSAHDLPVVEGVAVYFTLIVIVVNLFVDIAYGLLSPKVRVR